MSLTTMTKEEQLNWSKQNRFPDNTRKTWCSMHLQSGSLEEKRGKCGCDRCVPQKEQE